MVEVMQNNGKSYEPSKVHWFEFLLDDTLLEKHLQSSYPDPSATELIVSFLYQAEVAVALNKEISKSTENTADESVSNASESKKVLALKLLALRTAAFLNWNLQTFDNEMPLVMVYTLLTELLKLTDSPSPQEPWRHGDLDLTTLSGHCVFAIHLYHSWCLRTVVSDSLPTKPIKQSSVPVPGQTDPNMLFQNKRDPVMKQLRDGAELSARVLERLMWRQALMPTMHCFSPVTGDMRQLQHQWGQGVMLSSDEFTSQVAYDLGRYYFYKKDYAKAFDMFQIATDLMKKLQGQRQLCSIDETRLVGYLSACRAVIRAPSTADRKLSMFEQLMDILRSGKTENAVTVLKEECREFSVNNELLDWLCRQLSSKLSGTEAALCRHVSVIRHATTGTAVPVDYVTLLLSDVPAQAAICVEVCCEVLTSDKCTQTMRQNIKQWLEYLCLTLPAAFREHVRGSALLHRVFTPDELTALSANTPESTDIVPTLLSHPLADDDVVIQKLAVTLDINEIRELTNRLSAKQNKQQLTVLSERVKLPRDVQSQLETLPVVKAQFYVHMLVIKSRLCIEMKLFTKARELLQAADSTVRDISYKLSKMLRWELLRSDLLQHHHTHALPRDISQQELTKRVLSYITALQSEQDLRPNAELLEYSCSYLLGLHEYDHLTSFKDIGGCLRLSQLLAVVCKDVTSTSKEIKEAARDLWHSVSLIFMTLPGPSAAKRPALGQGRDLTLSPRSFADFVKKLTDLTAITVVISCLTRLFSILKVDVTSDIHCDYSLLWPNSIGNSSSMNVDGVGETLQAVLSHALATSAVNPTWLHTLADLAYSQSQYTEAMRYYLQLGMVVSDYFTDWANLLPVYTDDMIKRLIKCCMQLNCFTQVAVLCQMLDEVDYATAFKALQESNTCDAMDTYYDFIWDVDILEFLIHYHTRRGELRKRSDVLGIIGKLELNSSNHPDILQEAIRVRKTAFFSTLAKLYTLT